METSAKPRRGSVRGNERLRRGARPSKTPETPLRIDRLDHLVLTVADVERTVDFYGRVLGMAPVSFSRRQALTFGTSKINLHQVGHEFEPKGRRTYSAPSGGPHTALV